MIFSDKFKRNLPKIEDGAKNNEILLKWIVKTEKAKEQILKIMELKTVNE